MSDWKSRESNFAAGVDTQEYQRVHAQFDETMLLLPAGNAMTIFARLDIKYPQLGLFRVDATDQVLVDVRNRMR